MTADGFGASTMTSVSSASGAVVVAAAPAVVVVSSASSPQAANSSARTTSTTVNEDLRAIPLPPCGVSAGAKCAAKLAGEPLPERAGIGCSRCGVGPGSSGFLARREGPQHGGTEDGRRRNAPMDHGVGGSDPDPGHRGRRAGD